MRNTTKLIVALVAMLTIGASAGFAWTGTGTGTCTNGSDYFFPFATWEGLTQWDTTGTPWTISGFAGTWEDATNNESGTFSGTMVRTNAPNLWPGTYTSVGEWTRIIEVGGAYREVECGNYTIHFVSRECPSTSTCTGTWNTDYPGWYGNGNITGSFICGI